MTTNGSSSLRELWRLLRGRPRVVYVGRWPGPPEEREWPTHFHKSESLDLETTLAEPGAYWWDLELPNPDDSVIWSRADDHQHMFPFADDWEDSLPVEWFYLSFCDTNQPKGEHFLGAPTRRQP
jgi:hypothetical protein